MQRWDIATARKLGARAMTGDLAGDGFGWTQSGSGGGGSPIRQVPYGLAAYRQLRTNIALGPWERKRAIGGTQSVTNHSNKIRQLRTNQ